jgi:hypothetical protein
MRQVNKETENDCQGNKLLWRARSQCRDERWRRRSAGGDKPISKKLNRSRGDNYIDKKRCILGELIQLLSVTV